ncbi:MAG: hypothetical protein IIX45_02865 [Lachnospiraceae bacterium]|nr:hypothetical protein [Lachnospiraceae bacterium]
MDTLSCLIITFAASLIIGASTYFIQYCSVISPCNIEFDGRKSQELKIMNRYNRLFDRIYYIVMTVIMFCVIASMGLESTLFMTITVFFEIVYFILNIGAMSVMYIRSKIYWNIYENRIGEPIR